MAQKISAFNAAAHNLSNNNEHHHQQAAVATTTKERLADENLQKTLQQVEPGGQQAPEHDAL